MAEASMLAYGHASQAAPSNIIYVVETFGELELEYAALRKHCILLDLPHRAIVELSGPDRLDFLNRMVTQELKGLAPFHMRRSFWLNKKGRIDADMRIIDLPSRTLLEVDVHAAERTAKSLGGFIISEDAAIDDWTEKTHRLALHGPKSLQLITSVAQSASGADASGPSFDDLQPQRACVVSLFGHEVVIYREDQCGEIGLELIVPAKHALHIYQQLLEVGHDRSHGEESQNDLHTPPHSSSIKDLGKTIRLRPAGWHAFNIARIEAGTPIYNIDFSIDSLPAETGVLNDRVSFTKGCYLGQEIVARMHARATPKQSLVAIKFESKRDPESGLPFQPVSGTLVCPTGTTDAVGQVTSSTLAVMLSSTPVAFAMVKHAHTAPGTVLAATIEEGPTKIQVNGVVQPQLMFYRNPELQANSI